MTTEPTTPARDDLFQLTDDEIDAVGGGYSWGEFKFQWEVFKCLCKVLVS